MDNRVGNFQTLKARIVSAIVGKCSGQELVNVTILNIDVKMDWTHFKENLT